MRFYDQQHEFYCGVDLHANTLHVCVIDQAGSKQLHKNFQCSRTDVLSSELSRFGKGMVVGCESTFNWYWLADFSAEQEWPFVLGHALYMKAIHGGKSKSDSIDSEKIARLLRGGNFPLAYAYPKENRASRDLLRRRAFLVRRRAEAMTHVQMLHHQHNQTKPTNLKYKANRAGVGESLPDAHSQLIVQTDLNLIEAYSAQIARLEAELTRAMKLEDPQTYYRLQTIPGVGPILAMTIMLELHDIKRFAAVGNFLSYARLVKPIHTSAGKNYGSPGARIGNAHLRWAFGEAVCLLKRESPEACAYGARLEKKHGKARAMNMLAVKLGRAVYYMLSRHEAFDLKRFLN